MTSKTRIAYIDQIKVFLTCLVVAHHAAQAYGPTGGVWVVHDAARANWLGPFFFVNASFMMGLYFFISGYFMVFSMARKSRGQFVRDRLKRLGIPLLFFILVVFLPFNYLLSGSKMGLAPFLFDSYFNRPPIATGHLWFVASLLLYSLIYLVMGSVASQPVNARPVFSVWYIAVYVLLLALVSAWVRSFYPIDTWRTWIVPLEPAHLPQYFSLFVAGILFNRFGWLEAVTRMQGLLFLLVAAATYLWTKTDASAVSSGWLSESLTESLMCVGISMFLLSFFRHYANRQGPVSTLLSANAYGIYLFHLLIVIGLQSMLVHWAVPAGLKFTIVSLLGIVLSLGVSAGLRRIPLLAKII